MGSWINECNDKVLGIVDKIEEKKLSMARADDSDESYDDSNGPVKLFLALFASRPSLYYSAKGLPIPPSPAAKTRLIEKFADRYVQPISDAILGVVRKYGGSFDVETETAARAVTYAAISASSESENYHAYAEWKNVYYVDWLMRNGVKNSDAIREMWKMEHGSEMKKVTAAAVSAMKRALSEMKQDAEDDPISDYDDRSPEGLDDSSDSEDIQTMPDEDSSS